MTHLARDPRQRRALRTAVLAADAVTAVSPSLCRAAMQQLQLPAAPSMIANGVDTDLFRPAPATDAAPSTHRSPVLCHASNFRAVKRPLDCIDLLAALRDHGTAPRLEMIGDGPLRAAAKEHARALGLVGEVRFVDPLPQARLAEHLRAADIALVTSESESFGLVALEAMACGTVMAGWQCAGLTDMLHDAPQLCAELLAPLGDLDGLVQRVQRLLVSETAYDAARHRCLDIGRNHFRREAQLDQYELLLAPSPGGHPAWAADART